MEDLQQICDAELSLEQGASCVVQGAHQEGVMQEEEALAGGVTSKVGDLLWNYDLCFL